jgi:hypothetical protein
VNLSEAPAVTRACGFHAAPDRPHALGRQAMIDQELAFALGMRDHRIGLPVQIKVKRAIAPGTDVEVRRDDERHAQCTRYVCGTESQQFASDAAEVNHLTITHRVSKLLKETEVEEPTRQVVQRSFMVEPTRQAEQRLVHSWRRNDVNLRIVGLILSWRFVRDQKVRSRITLSKPSHHCSFVPGADETSSQLTEILLRPADDRPIRGCREPDLHAYAMIGSEISPPSAMRA